MRNPQTPLLATVLALALGACDMIGGDAPGASGGYRVAAAPAPILAAAPPADPAMDDYICRRNGVVLNVGAEACAAEGGFVALKPSSDDPIQWTADMWAPPALASLASRDDRALSRAAARPALAEIDLPMAPPAREDFASPPPLAPRTDERPQQAFEPSAAAAQPFDPASATFGAQESFAAAPPPPAASPREPYYAFDPCAYALLAGPGCPAR